MNIIKILSHKNNYNSSAPRSKKIKFIVIHYTGNNGDTAKGNGNYFSKSTGKKASAHYFVDKTTICQSVPENYVAYHCGTTGKFYHSTCRNSNSIGIEMVSKIDANGKYYIEDKVIENTVSFVKELMKKYNIPISNVVRHYDVTHKRCPEPFVREPQQWEKFLEKLKGVDEEVEIKNKVVKTPSGNKTLGMIEYDNTNYIALRDISKLCPVTIGYNNGSISIEPSKTKAHIIVNGKENSLDSILLFGTNYPELRKIAEALGYKVNYNSTTKKITLTK